MEKRVCLHSKATIISTSSSAIDWYMDQDEFPLRGMFGARDVGQNGATRSTDGTTRQ